MNVYFLILAGISYIVYNRRINIHGWITTDGKAYAVQFNEHRPSVIIDFYDR